MIIIDEKYNYNYKVIRIIVVLLKWNSFSVIFAILLTDTNEFSTFSITSFPCLRLILLFIKCDFIYFAIENFQTGQKKLFYTCFTR